MSTNFILIVGGPPASGKTTIAHKMSQDFHIPLIRKDAIKESLFESLGWSDREWSRQLGATTYKLMDQTAEMELQVGRSIILESNFKPELDNEKFNSWQTHFGVNYFQIFCAAPADVLRQRFKARVDSGERHPGHVDQDNYSLFDQKLLDATFAPLSVKGELIRIDSTRAFADYYPDIKEKFQLFISASA